MGISRRVEGTGLGIWICGWRSWFTSNSQCGAGQPTSMCGSQSPCLGKAEWNSGRSCDPVHCFTQKSHLPEDTVVLSVSAFVRAALSQPRFQPFLLRGWEMNGGAIHPVSRDSICLSGAAGLVVFECGPRLGLATLASSYFLGTWKSFLCCVHTCPRVLTHAHECTQSCLTPLWSVFPSVQWKL